MTENKQRFQTLSYIANFRIPSEKAHTVYLLKMCDAFKSLVPDVELVVPFRFQKHGAAETKDVYEIYSLRNRFRICTILSPDFLPLTEFIKMFAKFLFVMQSLIFAFLVTLRAALKPVCSLYITCDLWVALPMSFCFPSRLAFDIQSMPDSKIRKFILRRIIRRGVLIFSLTDAMKKILVADFKADNERVFVWPDGFDEELFNPSLPKIDARRICGLPEEVYIVGYVGRFTTMGESKGVEDLIGAARLIDDKKYLLLLVGDDESVLPPHKDICVQVVPYILQSKLLPYLRSCDVVIMPFPKKPHYEKCMSPMKLFEYMATGVPIISTDLPSIREVVGDKDVFFIEDNSPDRIAGAIRHLKENPQRGKALAESALRKSQRYTWKHRAESILSFLGNKLSGKNGIRRSGIGKSYCRT